jgi:GAF domain-containing protein
MDEGHGQLVVVGGTGEAGQTMLERGHRIPRGKGLVGRAAETNAPVFVRDVHLDPSWLSNPLLPETRAEIAVPIALGEQVLGVLDVQHNIPNGLTGADVGVLQSIANQVAIALQNARMVARLQQRAEQEALVNAVGRKIQEAASLDELLQVAVFELGEALHARRATVEVGRPGGMAAEAQPGQG